MAVLTYAVGGLVLLNVLFVLVVLATGHRRPSMSTRRTLEQDRRTTDDLYP
jgi:hypothetical protein